MRKLTLAIMAIALVLGMAQCKKDNTYPGGTRAITLRVDGSSNDSNTRISVNPNTGAVRFSTGDVIYAAYDGKYVGTLTYNGQDFTGNITTGEGDGTKKLAFYFMGNKTPEETLTAGTTSTLTVNIYNQTKSLPVISAGLSNEPYSGNAIYTATLENKCALVKFNVTSDCNSDVPTIITGVNDRVEVTFASGSVGAFNNMQEKGAVRLPGGSGERWAILLPSTEGAPTNLAYSCDLHYNGVYGPFPALANNDYLADGIDVNLENALSGFTIKKDGTKVFFAPGNLQATTTNNGASWTYAFAENQYDVLGEDGGINEAITDKGGHTNANGTLDLFCWVGANAGSEMQTYGIVNDYNRADYGNKHNEYLKSDWGNAVGNIYGRSWSLPEFTRFTYMLGFMQRKSNFPENATAGGDSIYDHRASSTVCGVANARFAIGQIHDSYHNKIINGLFIFPDVYTHPAGIPPLQHINENPRDNDSTSINYNDNFITLAQWTQMEAMGCAFLPATGVRDVAENETLSVIYPQIGGYWQNSSKGIMYAENGNNVIYSYNELKADMMFFSEKCVYSNDHYHRSYGFGVRLVSD